MPTISRFFGILISMYYNDHNPPHFHARHGDFKAVYEISTLRALEGELPPKAHKYVVNWASMHRDALMDNWALAQSGEKPFQIPGLE